MCTGIFTKTEDGKHLLSRTMDFSMELDPSPLYLPRQFQWTSAVDGVLYTSQYGFVGAGRLLEKSYFVADGINEKGLSIAELYLPGEVDYATDIKEGATNLAPHEFILWVLSQFSTIEELEKVLKDVNLVAKEVPMLGIVTPLHWIITDQTGRCVVIEPTTLQLKTIDNPIGVMTNSPQLDWHINNLRNYLHVRPAQYAPKKFDDYIAEPFSQGTGTLGLPGGFTPPERFVRAAFFKEHIEPAHNELEGLNNHYHILANVRIPKGIVVTDAGISDYSQYVGSMCNESLTYYYSSYENPKVISVQLTDTLLATKQPRFFSLEPTFTVQQIDV